MVMRGIAVILALLAAALSLVFWWFIFPALLMTYVPMGFLAVVGSILSIMLGILMWVITVALIFKALQKLGIAKRKEN